MNRESYYQKVKINNGWLQQSLDDIESINKFYSLFITI